MNNNTYNYHSSRAKEARLGHILNSTPIIFLLILIAIVLVALGAWLLYLKISFAWLALGCAVIPVIILIWIKRKLAHIPIGHNNSINDYLSVNCLISLGPDPTPQSIAKIIQKPAAVAS